MVIKTTRRDNDFFTGEEINNNLLIVMWLFHSTQRFINLHLFNIHVVHATCVHVIPPPFNVLISFTSFFLLSVWFNPYTLPSFSIIWSPTDSKTASKYFHKCFGNKHFKYPGYINNSLSPHGFYYLLTSAVSQLELFDLHSSAPLPMMSYKGMHITRST